MMTAHGATHMMDDSGLRSFNEQTHFSDESTLFSPGVVC